MHLSLFICYQPQNCSACSLLLLSWPNKNQSYNGVKGKKMLHAPCRIYFYLIVLCCTKKSDWPISSFLSFSVNCGLFRTGDFSSPGLVESLVLIVLILPVHRTCSFYWREGVCSAQTHFYCVCIQPWLFLSSGNLNCHEDVIDTAHCTLQHMQGWTAEIPVAAFVIMYFRRGKMNCWGEKSNAEHELFTAMVINSVHGLACEHLTCQHVHGAYSHKCAAGKASQVQQLIHRSGTKARFDW